LGSDDLDPHKAMTSHNLTDDTKDLILAVETSSRTGSAAIADARGVLAFRPFSGQLRHNSELLPTVRAMLRQLAARPDQIRQVYIASGPGSFTGIRMAVTMAKTMHLALGARIVAVDTLDVIAANVPVDQLEDRLLVPVLDAKMNRFFAAGYLSAPPGKTGPQPIPGLAKVIPDTVATAQAIRQFIEDIGRPACLVGDGLLYYRHLFEGPRMEVMDPEYWAPSAINVFKLGRLKAAAGLYEDPLRLVPNYLLPPQVTVSSK